MVVFILNLKTSKLSVKTTSLKPNATALPTTTNDSLRDRVRQQLCEGLSKVFIEAKEDTRHQVDACNAVDVAALVESCLFKKWGRFDGSQKAKYRSLLFNIKNPKNPDFRRKVLLGEIKAEAIVNLSVKDMASNEMQYQFKEIETRSLLKSVIGTVDKGTTDQFKCDQCGERETTYCQMQTRSADEPMTTYVTCIRCNHHWKFC